jgi:hypothetical protein
MRVHGVGEAEEGHPISFVVKIDRGGTFDQPANYIPLFLAQKEGELYEVLTAWDSSLSIPPRSHGDPHRYIDHGSSEADGEADHWVTPTPGRPLWCP